MEREFNISDYEYVKALSVPEFHRPNGTTTNKTNRLINSGNPNAGLLKILDFSVQEWREDASCFGVDPELFFPQQGASSREAKKVCKGCPVRIDCLEFAIINNEKIGIWGGLSRKERITVKKSRTLESETIKS